MGAFFDLGHDALTMMEHAITAIKNVITGKF